MKTQWWTQVIVPGVILGGLAWMALPTASPAITVCGTERAPTLRCLEPNQSREHVGSSALGTDSIQDSSLITGTLPNGLTYYIQRAPTPKGRADLRLAVKAGSLNEDDDQTGYAHFLEHMAFNGTRSFPGTSLVDYLELSGVDFGADLNASTGFEWTIYRLNVPTDNDSLFATGIQIFQEFADGGILIDSLDVIAERGVVLGEWRTRLMDSASKEKLAFDLGVTYGEGSRYLRRIPIGLLASLKNAQSGPIRRFYHDWYRPDLMAIIIVGDIDVPRVQKDVIERFGSIPAPSQKRPAPDLEVRLSVDSSELRIFKGSINPSVTVSWHAHGQQSTTARASDNRKMGQDLVTERIKADLMDAVVLRYLSNRFQQLTMQANRPFASAAMRTVAASAPLGEGYELTAVALPDSLQSALAAAFAEVERLRQGGVPEELLNAAKQQVLSLIEQPVKAGRVSADVLADEYIQHFLGHEPVIVSPQRMLDLAKTILPSITGRSLADHVNQRLSGAPPLFTMTWPLYAEAAPPNLSDLKEILVQTPVPPLEAVEGRTSAKDTQIRAVSKTPGQIVNEDNIPAAGITVWTLSNGARVFLKPMPTGEPNVTILATSVGGLSQLPDSLLGSPGRLVGAIMTDLGNPNSSGIGELNPATQSERFRVSLNSKLEQIQLSGESTDIDAMFQRLYQQFVEPTIDPGAVEQWKKVGANRVRFFDDPNDAGIRPLFLHSPRLAALSPALVPMVTPHDVLSVFRDRFGDAGDFDFIIVGRFDPTEVRRLTEQYLASLPSLKKATREEIGDLQFPFISPGIREQEEVSLDVPKAIFYLLFGGKLVDRGDRSLSQMDELDALVWILRRELRLRLREELGATYGVGVGVMTYFTPGLRYTFRIQFDSDPLKINDAEAITRRVIDSLREFGTSPDLIAAYLASRKHSFTVQSQSQRYWLQTIVQYNLLGVPLTEIPKQRETMTPEMIRQAAIRYLPKDSYTLRRVFPTKDAILKQWE